MSPRWTATAHENAVFDVAWTCDDARVLTASADTTAAMFDVETKAVSYTHLTLPTILLV